MRKIKSIDIESFRCYSDKQIFDFSCSTRNVADLIVLYAPNGFGKTSLFDAIEWGLLGGVKRLFSKGNIAKFSTHWKGQILRNHSENGSNIGRVKIKLEDDDLLERVTNQHGRARNDFNAGKIKNNFICKEEDMILFDRHNILSQNEIDAFLRFETPEERYKALSELWDKDRSSEVYRAISLLYFAAAKKRGEFKKKITNIKQEIADLNISSERLTAFNDTVKNINSYNYTKEYTSLKVPLEKKQVDLYEVDIARDKSDIEKKKEERDRALIDLTKLKNEYVEYKETINKCKIEKGEKKELVEIISKSKELDAVRGKMKELLKQLTLDNNRLSNFNYIKQHADYYLKHVLQLENHTLKVNSIEREKEEVEKNSKVVKQEIITFEERSIASNNEKDDLSEKFDFINESIDLFFHLNKEVSEVESFLKKIDGELENKNILLDNLLEKKVLLSEYYNKDVNAFCMLDFELEEYRDIFSQLQSTGHIIELKEERLKSEQGKYSELTSLNEQLQIIIYEGKEYIKDSKISTCPLCKTNFNSFDILLQKVDTTMVSNELLDESIRTIEKLKAEVVKEKKAQNKKYEYIKSLLQGDIKALEQKINEEKIEREKVVRKREENTHRITIMQSKLSSLKDEFIKIDSNFDFKDFDSLRDNCKKKLIVLNDSIQNIQQEIVRLNKVLSEDKVKTIELEHKLKVKKTRVIEFENDSLFVNFKRILKEVDFNDDSQLSNVEVFIKELSKNIEQMNIGISGHNAIIKKLTSEISSYDIHGTNVKIKTITHNIEEYQKIINSYEDIALKYFDTKIKSKELIIDKITSYNNEKKKYTNFLDLIEKLNIELSYIKKSVGLSEKYIQLENLEKEQAKVSKAREELLETRKSAGEYIKKRINTCLDRELMNKIYNIIDPHPDYKNIAFEPKLNDKDAKTELDILTVSKDDSKKIEPILYFSTAQVNILALSIFLARALKNDSSYINTIFLDDPIQSMDSINILSFIDLLRMIITNTGRQIFISTHDDNLFRLLQKKLPPEYYKTKFLELKSYGQVK